MPSVLRGAERRTSLVPADVLAVHVGGPATAAWREDALCRVAETEALRRRCVAALPAAGDDAAAAAALAGARAVDESAGGHLRAARESAAGEAGGWWRRTRAAVTGTAAVRTWANVQAAEVQVLRIASPEVLRGALPGLLVHLRRYLPPGDPRVAQVTVLAAGHTPLVGAAREALASAVAAGYAAERAARARLIRLRGLVYAATAMLTATVAALLLVAVSWPGALTLCLPYGPGQVACPTGMRTTPPLPSGEAVSWAATGGDAPVVALLGLVAAALTAAATTRLGRPDVPEVGLAAALLLVKLPWGALTAVLGILAVRAVVVGAVPLGTGQILGLALLCGLFQQVFSGLLDRRVAQAVADAAGSPPPAAPPAAHAVGPGAGPEERGATPAGEGGLPDASTTEPDGPAAAPPGGGAAPRAARHAAPEPGEPLPLLLR